MNKKLLAVAVAGVLAAPAAALAQSSVTISGFFKGGFESLHLGNFNNATSGRVGAAGSNSSQTGVADDSSRIIFNVTEDLGGGLQAIGQIDMRFGLDTGALAATGNTHVGLRSKSWGRLFIGRQDLHYFNRESDLTVRGSLRADSISILAFGGAGFIPIAGATRTTNVVHYTTPNWGGFTLIAAYSANPTAAEADIGSGARKGSAWNLNPNLAGSNYQVGYSFWRSKPDGGGTTVTIPANFPVGAPTTNADQRGDRLYGSYRWGGFKVGLAWDRSKLKTSPGGVELSNRTAWSIPASYTWGPHSVHAHWDKARSDKAAVLSGLDTKANMFAVSYAYDLSKRTSAAVTYARINNGAAAGYNLFTNASLGIGGAGVALGEDPRLWAITMRHAF